MTDQKLWRSDRISLSPSDSVPAVDICKCAALVQSLVKLLVVTSKYSVGTRVAADFQTHLAASGIFSSSYLVIKHLFLSV